MNRLMKAAALAVSLKYRECRVTFMRDVLGRNDRKSDYTYDEEKPKDITALLMKLSELSLMTSWQGNRISTRTMI